MTIGNNTNITPGTSHTHGPCRKRGFPQQNQPTHRMTRLTVGTNRWTQSQKDHESVWDTRRIRQ